MSRRFTELAALAGLVGISLSGCGGADGSSASSEQWLSDVQGNSNESSDEEQADPGQGENASEPRDSIIPPMAGPEGWDPSDPNFVQFNPCEDIPTEVFDQVGMQDLEVIKSDFATTCSSLIRSGELFGDSWLVLLSVTIPPPDWNELELDLVGGYRTSVPGLFVATSADGARSACSSLAPTEGGLWGLQYEKLTSEEPSIDQCDDAVRLLEEIYLEVEEFES